jgi:CMP/dCMP kinase
MQNKLLIAIDGPSASGKGTLSKLIGKKLGLPVLYTGNIYRAIAYKVYISQGNPHDVNSTIELAKELVLKDLDNPDLSQDQIGQYASIIGSYPELRDVTYSFQRDFIENSEGAVIEGRDIGTVICPEARFKFYITASAEVRAQRRAFQLSGDYQTILKDLIMRDDRDLNRIVAPLKPAEDAVIIDSSSLDAKETLNKMLKVIL